METVRTKLFFEKFGIVIRHSLIRKTFLLLSLLIFIFLLGCARKNIERIITVSQPSEFISKSLPCKDMKKEGDYFVPCSPMTGLRIDGGNIFFVPLSSAQVEKLVSMQKVKTDQNRLPSLFFLFLIVENHSNETWILNRTSQIIRNGASKYQAHSFWQYYYTYRSTFSAVYTYGRIFFPLFFDQEKELFQKKQIQDQAKSFQERIKSRFPKGVIIDEGYAATLKQIYQNLNHKAEEFDSVTITPKQRVAFLIAWPQKATFTSQFQMEWTMHNKKGEILFVKPVSITRSQKRL